MKFILCLFLVGLTLSAQAQYKNIYTRNAWEERDKWQRPDRLIAATGIEEGSRIADIGCHEGYMTVKFSAVVGNEGKVYAVDVNRYRLEKLEEYLEEASIENVEVIKGDYDNPNLPLNTLDVAFILDTYHEMDDYEVVLQHIKASLKSGGRLVIIEPIAKERKSWSRDRQTGRHEIAIRYVEQELKEAGFEIAEKDEMFLDRRDEKGDHLWLLVAVKS